MITADEIPHQDGRHKPPEGGHAETTLSGSSGSLLWFFHKKDQNERWSCSLLVMRPEFGSLASRVHQGRGGLVLDFGLCAEAKVEN